MNNSKFSNVHGWSLLNNGIRAATETQLRKNTDKKFLAFYTAESLKTEPLLLTRTVLFEIISAMLVYRS